MQNKTRKLTTTRRNKKMGGKWSIKYKKSINCNRPKGFSQKQHCKYGRKNHTKNIDKYKKLGEIENGTF